MDHAMGMEMKNSIEDTRHDLSRSFLYSAMPIEEHSSKYKGTNLTVEQPWSDSRTIPRWDRVP